MLEDPNSSSSENEVAFAEFIVSLSFDDLPEAAVRTAERRFVDTVGVTLAGSAEGAGQIAVETADVLGPNGEFPLIGTERSSTLSEATFANAAAGHGIDYDDVAKGVWHPSTPMVAPILLLAQKTGASGPEMLTAYVAGFEIQSSLSDVMLPDHYEAGWHATATFGTFGAAAAASNLLDLDVSRTRQAIALAASLPSGLKKNFGTMAKPMHAGQAARSGLTAAMLANNDFTAAAGALFGERGFCDLYDGSDFQDSIVTPGDPLAIVEDGIQTKKYPCCYFTHAPIAATEWLRNTHDIQPDEIDRVEVIASQGADDALHYPDPKTGLEAKFSMEYPVAAELVDGPVTLQHFDDENVDTPAIQAVAEGVSLTVDESLPYEPFPATVRIETTDGDLLERQQEDIPGTKANPITDEELRSKFQNAAARAPAVGDVAKAYTLLDELRSLEEVSKLHSELSKQDN